jgi:serine/threonine protein kinase
MLTSGSRLGPYEIIALIGTGGMGEVWRARDTRLDRNVAIKIMAAAFASDAEFLRRFDREARTISQLSHPNICTLHDVGEGYIVMELLSGETLAERIARGPLPLADVLRIGTEIASALAAAHKQGVVHRDLKPANVMLTKSGAKLLDFGLAKDAVIDVGPYDATRQRAVTAEGTIIGTFQYMAPEQLEGSAADARTDIFALGALLYELATGKHAFEGRTRTSLIAAIVAGQPRPVHELQPLMPAALDHVIALCLAKDPDDRWQSASDVAKELQWISAGHSEKAERPPRAMWFPWAIAAISVIALIGTLLTKRETARTTAPMQFTTIVPGGQSISMSVLSPDAKSIAFVAKDVSGQSLLWVHRLDSTTSQAFAGTDDPKFPFWSPDSRYIAFFSQGKLKKVDITGGKPQELCIARNGRGGAWNRDGVIMIAGAGAGALDRLPANGGTPIPVTKLDSARGESSHRFPLFLSDGRRYLFLVTSFGTNRDASKLGIYAGSLDSPEQKMLVRAQSNVSVANGHLLFVRDQTLYAQKFDEKQMTVEGEPVPIVQGVRYWPSVAWADFTARDSVLAYQIGGSTRTTQFVWFDRTGKETGRLPDRGELANPRLSPNGDKLLFDSVDALSGNIDVWLASTKGPLRQRLTFDVGNDTEATWSADGQSIAFTTYDKAMQVIGRKVLGGREEIVYGVAETSLGSLDMTDASIIFREHSSSTDWDIKMLNVGSSKPTNLFTTAAAETDARCSPNRKWIAYVSNESGRAEVYLTTFPSPGTKWQVSTSGGTEPRWRRDSGELFFLDPAKRIVSVAITNRTVPEIGPPQVLFRAIPRELVSGTDLWTYDVSPDGRSILVNVDDAATADTPLVFSIDWDVALRRAQ